MEVSLWAGASPPDPGAHRAAGLWTAADIDQHDILYGQYRAALWSQFWSWLFWVQTRRTVMTDPKTQGEGDYESAKRFQQE